MHRHEAFLRTVRLTRSHSGFGFTITGQQPCILSCIVRGSPAYEVGLHAGDLVVGVNGADVTAAFHDEVVRLIGNSGITITLQIMERRHRSRHRSSSSSGDLSIDENVSPSKGRRTEGRRRHRRSHRSRPISMHAGDAAGAGGPMGYSPLTTSVGTGSSRSRSKEMLPTATVPSSRHAAHSAVHSGRADGPWSSQARPDAAQFLKKRTRASAEVPKVVDARPRDSLRHLFPNALVPPAQLRPSGELRPDDTYEQPAATPLPAEPRRTEPAGSRASAEPILRALIGYCGSVEVPSEHLAAWHKLNALRSALSRLKTESRVLLVLEVRPAGVRLVNHLGRPAAEFPADRLAFYGAHPDDERYFGLVLALTGPRSAFSCSIFRVLDPELCRHEAHATEVRAWGLSCHINSRGGCREVPASPGGILRCLASTFGPAKSHLVSSSPGTRAARPQSVPPQPAMEAPRPPEPLRSRSPHVARPGSVPPPRDAALEDKLSPRALLRPGADPQFKVPLARAPPQQPQVGSVEKDQTLPTSNPPLNGAVSLANRASSVSHNSILLVEDLHRPSLGPSASANLSTANTTLAHSEKSVYKTVTKETQLDEDLSRVAKWATNFDNLLSDKHGVATFTDFLKSEFSEENILFWLAVEKFRRIQDDAYRRFRAQELFQRFISPDAPESINVDASCLDALAGALKSPPSDPLPSSLFDTAQFQIYNLMRLDSYVRFLKSPLYKSCMVGEMEHRPLPSHADSSTLVTPERGLKAAKSSSSLGQPDSEDKKRRSLFPWIRKSKRYGKSASGSNASGSQLDLKKPSPSRSASKKENEFEAVGKAHCRINFPDGSSTVIRPNATTEATARQCLQAVCAKRGVAMHATEVLSASSPDKFLDLSAPAASLGGRTLVLEARAVFRLEIPAINKTLGVRAKLGKALKDVLKTVCGRYGLKLDNYACWPESVDLPLAMDTPVKEIDHSTLILHPKEEKPERIRVTSAELAQWLTGAHFDGHGIFDPQAPAGTPTGTKTGTWREKRAERRSALRKSASASLATPSTVADPNNSDNERFLEILTRMNNQRLDDQRGRLPSTPLELPDFLKPKPAPAAAARSPPDAASPVFASSAAAGAQRPASVGPTTFRSPTRAGRPSASPDLPFMDASILTSTPRSRSRGPLEVSPVFAGPPTFATNLYTPPPPNFRDRHRPAAPRTQLPSGRSTPSPTTHLLLPPDSPLHTMASSRPSFRQALEDDDRVTFV